MGADDDIHHALFQILYRLFDLRRGAETAHQCDIDGEILHSLHKGIVMLLRQNGGGNQIDDLFPLLHSLEGGTDGDLGLTVTYVSADQTVHDPVTLHVRLGIRNGIQLILRLLEGEHFLELPLPYGIFSKSIAFTLLSDRIQLHQILRHGTDGAAYLRLGMLPFLAAQFVQLRLLRRIGGGILLDHIQSGSQNVQITAVPVFNLEVVLDNLVYLDLLDTFIYPQSMGLMHHIIPDFQVIKVVDFLPLIEFFLLFPALLRSENIALGQHHEFQPGIFKALVHMAVVGQDFPWLHLPHGILRVYRRQSRILRVAQILCQTSGSGTGTGQQKYPVAVLFVFFQIPDQCFEAAVIGSNVAGSNVYMLFRPEISVPGLHGSQRHHGIFLQRSRYLFAAVENVHLSRQHVAFSGTLLHALPEFQFDGIRLLFHSRRFINIEGQGTSRHIRQQFRQGHGIFIKIADITFQIDLTLKFQQLFLQFTYLCGDPVGFLRLMGIPEGLFLLCSFLLKPCDAFADLLFRQHEFRGRVDCDALQFFNGALA